MKEIEYLKQPMIDKLNLAEYTNYMSRFYALTQSEGCAALGIEVAPLERLGECLELLTDAVGRNLTAPESEEMEQLHQQRIQLGQYIITCVRNAQQLPNAAFAQAAQALALVVKPLVMFYRRPRMQVSALIDAVLFDLAKDPCPHHLEVLSLSDVVAELAATNARYRTLADSRIRTRQSLRPIDGKTLRSEVNVLYKYLTTLAFCHSVCHPSATTARYISRLNAIIDETKTSHRQRCAKRVRRAGGDK